MITSLQLYEATSIELSKLQAPSLKLYEFNYYVNKSINQFTNKVYNIYDINQQTSDDLRVLKSTAELVPKQIPASTITKKLEASYEVFLPLDYLHLLNCICIYEVMKPKNCWDVGDFVEIPATRLTADSWSQVVADIYNRPSPMKPYFYIHNVNQYNNLPTDPIKSYTTNTGLDNIGTDIDHAISNEEKIEYLKTNPNTKWIYLDDEQAPNDVTQGGYRDWNQGILDLGVEQIPQYQYDYLFKENEELLQEMTFPKGYSRVIKLNTGKEVSTINKPEGLRLGNSSNVRMEIRYGKDTSVFELRAVKVDYVKVPQYIKLTQSQLDSTEDTSQILEFPDYVVQEIINELVHLIMGRISDPTLQTHYQITQSIARPTQQQEQTT